MAKARNPSAFALMWWAHHGAAVRGPSNKPAKPSAAMIAGGGGTTGRPNVGAGGARTGSSRGRRGGSRGGRAK